MSCLYFLKKRITSELVNCSLFHFPLGYCQGTLTLYFFLLSGEANMHNIIKLVSEDMGLWGLKEHNIYSGKVL